MLIERYITGEIIKPFAAGLGLLLVIFIAFSSAIKLTDAAAGQLPAATVIQLIALNTLIACEVLIPSTLYLAILFAVGRLYRDSEMAALFAAGVGETKLLKTAFALGLIGALIVSMLSIYGRPWAYKRSYELEQDTISRFDLSQIQPGRFIDLSTDGYVLHARGVDVEHHILERVFLQRTVNERSEIIAAREARIHDSDGAGTRRVEFTNGHAYLLDDDGSRDYNQSFNTLIVSFPEEERITRYRRKAIDTWTLGTSQEPKEIAEYQWRLSTPLATILLAMLAIPLSRANPRQSRFATFVVAVIAYLFLFSCTGLVRNWVEDGKMPASPGLYVAYVPVALLLLGMVMMPGRALGGWWRR